MMVVLRLQSKDLTSVPTLEYSAVTELYLDYNCIEEIPEQICEEICNLEVLSIIGNDLNHLPENIHKISGLREIFCNENHLEYIPNSFCKLCQLQVINVVGNFISEFPRDFGNLKHLKHIFCEENQLKCLPISFGELLNLEVAEFNNNVLSCLPLNFGHLTNLRILNLSNNKLTELPESFQNLTNLEELDISHNGLCSLPERFASKCCIKKLYFDSNHIMVLPEWINEMPAIELLSFSENETQGNVFSDDIAVFWQSLKELNLPGNNLTSLPMGIGCLTSLHTLHLGSPLEQMEKKNMQNGNWLIKLPDSFPNLTNLKHLRLDENQLEELPHDFGKLANLEELNLGQNRLWELPETFGDLKSLRICVLSVNNLVRLPSNIGNLRHLSELLLDNNKLTELPESFNQLQSLETLDLFNNQLTALPESLNTMTNIKRLDLSQNPLPIHHLRVPHKNVDHYYAPRDPKHAGNWRGRTRLNVIENLKEEIKEVACDGYEIPYEPEPNTANNEYSEYALRYAASQSLWRTHSDARKTREKIIRDDIIDGKYVTKPTFGPNIRPAAVGTPTAGHVYENIENWEDECDNKL